MCQAPGAPKPPVVVSGLGRFFELKSLVPWLGEGDGWWWWLLGEDFGTNLKDQLVFRCRKLDEVGFD